MASSDATRTSSSLADALSADEHGILLSSLPLVSRCRLVSSCTAFRFAADHCPAAWSVCHFPASTRLDDVTLERIVGRSRSELTHLAVPGSTRLTRLVDTVALALPSLTSVDLRGCTGLKEYSVRTLLERAPNLESLLLSGACRLNPASDEGTELGDRVLALTTDVERCSEAACRSVGACKTCVGCGNGFCTTVDWLARESVQRSTSCAMCSDDHDWSGGGCADEVRACAHFSCAPMCACADGLCACSHARARVRR
jgi:hypothetical protein